MAENKTAKFAELPDGATFGYGGKNFRKADLEKGNCVEVTGGVEGEQFVLRGHFMCSVASDVELEEVTASEEDREPSIEFDGTDDSVKTDDSSTDDNDPDDI